LKGINERELDAYLEKWTQRRLGRRLETHFRGTIVLVSGTMPPFTVQIQRTGETGSDGNTYACSVPGYVPQIGDSVELAWRDLKTAHVVRPVKTTAPRDLGALSTAGAPSGSGFNTADKVIDSNSVQWIRTTGGAWVQSTPPTYWTWPSGAWNWTKARVALASGRLTGPYTISQSFSTTYSGSTLAISVSGTCYATAAATLMSVECDIDGANVGNLELFANEANSHKALQSLHTSYAGIGSGSHTVSLQIVTGNTTSDGNDRASILILELPT
jgi:hypothetical protein